MGRAAIARAAPVARRQPGDPVRVVGALALLPQRSSRRSTYRCCSSGWWTCSPTRRHLPIALPLGLLVGYGVLRIAAIAFAELRDARVRARSRSARSARSRCARSGICTACRCASTSSARPAASRARSSAARSGISTLLSFMLFNDRADAARDRAGRGDPVGEVRLAFARGHVRRGGRLHRATRSSSPSGA